MIHFKLFLLKMFLFVVPLVGTYFHRKNEVLSCIGGPSGVRHDRPV